MSAQSKGTASSSSSPSEGPPAASKAKVKEQIKIIVEDLELVLGDLKDVAKELKEVRSARSGELRGRPPVCPPGSSIPARGPGVPLPSGLRCRLRSFRHFGAVVPATGGRAARGAMPRGGGAASACGARRSGTGGADGARRRRGVRPAVRRTGAFLRAPRLSPSPVLVRAGGPAVRTRVPSRLGAAARRTEPAYLPLQAAPRPGRIAFAVFLLLVAGVTSVPLIRRRSAVTAGAGKCCS